MSIGVFWRRIVDHVLYSKAVSHGNSIVPRRFKFFNESDGIMPVELTVVVVSHKWKI